MLKKVANDVSGIIVSDEADIMTRMEVFSGVITEMEKMFAMLSVSTTAYYYCYYYSSIQLYSTTTAPFHYTQPSLTPPLNSNLPLQLDLTLLCQHNSNLPSQFESTPLYQRNSNVPSQLDSALLNQHNSTPPSQLCPTLKSQLCSMLSYHACILLLYHA